MAAMNDVDRNVFSEAYKTVLDNFTSEKLDILERAAVDVKGVLDAAKKRLPQERRSA